MRNWLDLSTDSFVEGKVVKTATPSYLEVEAHSADANYPAINYSYIFPLDQGNFVTAACWEHFFDSPDIQRLMQLFFHPKLGPDWIKAFSEARPTFAELFMNAIEGRYSRGALVNFEDPDDGERKWHVVTFVGNTPPKETYEEVWDDGRIVDADLLVVARSWDMAHEWTTSGSISLATQAKMFAKGFVADFPKDLETSFVWISRLSQLSSN